MANTNYTTEIIITADLFRAAWEEEDGVGEIRIESNLLIVTWKAEDGTDARLGIDDDKQVALVQGTSDCPKVWARVARTVVNLAQNTDESEVSMAIIAAARAKVRDVEEFDRLIAVSRRTPPKRRELPPDAIRMGTLKDGTQVFASGVDGWPHAPYFFVVTREDGSSEVKTVDEELALDRLAWDSAELSSEGYKFLDGLSRV